VSMIALARLVRSRIVSCTRSPSGEVGDWRIPALSLPSHEFFVFQMWAMGRRCIFLDSTCREDWAGACLTGQSFKVS
jgi:hypothetical protein